MDLLRVVRAILVLAKKAGDKCSIRCKCENCENKESEEGYSSCAIEEDNESTDSESDSDSDNND